MKSACNMKLKAFFITFEGLPVKQILAFFLEGESPTLIKLQRDLAQLFSCRFCEIFKNA